MSYFSEVMADSPGAYWRMDEASGLIQDSSGNANHATSSTGTALYSRTPAIGVGTSIWLTGDDRFLISPSASISPGNVFTCEAWVFLQDLGTSKNILNKSGDASTVGGYQFRIEDVANKLTLGRATFGDIVQSTTSLTANTWYHCVATKNGATSKLYLNGVDVTGAVTDRTCDPMLAGDLFFGASVAPDQFMNGYLDEVALYPTALSQARVQVHYNAGASSTTMLPMGMLGTIRV